MRRFLIASSCVIGLAALGVTPASAQQSRPERPYRGLFGGGVDGARHLLTANLRIGGGYSTGLFLGQATTGESTTPIEQRSSATYNNFNGGLTYSLNAGRATMNASAAANGRYFPEYGNTVIVGYGGAVAGTFALSTRTSVRASQGLSYQPLFNLPFFADAFEPVEGLFTPIDQAFGTTEVGYRSVDTNAGVEHQLTRRSRFTLAYRRGRSDGTGDAASRDQIGRVYQDASAQLQFALSRILSLRLGYGYGWSEADMASQPDAPARFTSQRIDAGVDVSKAIALTRRTRLAFSTGTTAISDQNNTQVTVIGNASLTREVGRTWNVGLNYVRNVRFVDTLQQPVFSDAVGLGVGGLLNRRMSFQSSVGAAFGRIGLGVDTNTPDRRNNRYTSYYTTAGLSIGLTRNLALTTSYTYYRYTVDDVSPLPASARFDQLNRHAVQASLELWAPLFQSRNRSRSTNASR
ncbi:MAG: hypothetical protein R2752_03740 [Vicinamibacterales bacterium]